MSRSTLAHAPSIAVVDGKPTTLSTDVARHFGKQHYNVLRDINNLRSQLDADHALNSDSKHQPCLHVVIEKQTKMHATPRLYSE